MKVIQTLIGVTCGGIVALAGMAGCDISVHRSHPEPVYVAQPQPEYVVVREAPPAIIVERRPPPPNQGLVWIDGYWEWNGRQYVWEPGHWAAPPRGGVIWIAPRYERHEQGYRYMPGRWSEERREEEHRDRH